MKSNWTPFLLAASGVFIVLYAGKKLSGK